MFKKIFLIAMFLIASIAYRSISFAQTDSTSEVAVTQEAPLTVETETSGDKVILWINCQKYVIMCI